MASVTVTARWQGLDELLREVDKWDGGIKWGDGELKRMAEQIAEKAREFVPVDTGALKGSIRVAQPRDAKGRFKTGWGIYAGGDSAPYAVYVHENLQARHTTGHAKFLETAAMAVFTAWRAQADGIQLP